MNPEAKIYVAGHSGLVGSAIVRALCWTGYSNLLVSTHAELDLTNQAAVKEFFESQRPGYVFLAAARVGGILANSLYPADFIFQNLLIQTNVIDGAYNAGRTGCSFLARAAFTLSLLVSPFKKTACWRGPSNLRTALMQWRRSRE